MITTLLHLSLPLNPSRCSEDRLRPFVKRTGPWLRRTLRVDPRVPCEVSDARRRKIEANRTDWPIGDKRDPKAEFAVRFDSDDRDVDRWVEVTFNGRPLRRIDANEAGAINLSPPFLLADRNELRFLHRYRVRSDVVRSDAYRIGSTGRFSPVDIQVTSGGRDHGALASCRVNGHEMVTVPRRGYNVVALDETDGRVLWVETFDTFRNQAESRRMADRIGALPPGTLVIAAVKVDGGGQLTSEGVAALRSVGGQQDLQHTLWRSHALIGVRGAPPGSAIEATGMQRITLSVGQERGLTVMLGAFSLR